jgi:hypothetical protein
VIARVFGDDTKMAGDTMGMRSVRVLLLCAVAVLSACNKDAGTPASPAPAPAKLKAPVVVKKGPTAAEQTAGMVEAVGQGKSQLPIDLKFDVSQKPKVGQSLEINLALIAQISASPATIQVNAADGFSVAPGAGQFDIPSVEPGEVYRQTVNVTPTAEGVLLVGVTVLLKHDEMTDQRAFSIPIIAER